MDLKQAAGLKAGVRVRYTGPADGIICTRGSVVTVPTDDTPAAFIEWDNGVASDCDLDALEIEPTGYVHWLQLNKPRVKTEGGCFLVKFGDHPHTVGWFPTVASAVDYVVDLCHAAKYADDNKLTADPMAGNVEIHGPLDIPVGPLRPVKSPYAPVQPDFPPPVPKGSRIVLHSDGRRQIIPPTDTEA